MTHFAGHGHWPGLRRRGRPGPVHSLRPGNGQRAVGRDALRFLSLGRRRHSQHSPVIRGGTDPRGYLEEPRIPHRPCLQKIQPPAGGRNARRGPAGSGLHLAVSGNSGDSAGSFRGNHRHRPTAEPGRFAVLGGGFRLAPVRLWADRQKGGAAYADGRQFCPDRTGPEWNVEMGLTSARLIQETWPGEINLLGWEAGADVIALREPHALSPKNPAARPIACMPAARAAAAGVCARCNGPCFPIVPSKTPSTPGLVTLGAQGVSHWRPMPGGRHQFLSSVRRAGGNRRGYEKNLTAFDLKRQPGSGIDRRAYAGCSLFHFSYSAAMTLSMGARPSSTSCTSASAETRASISTAEVSVPMNS